VAGMARRAALGNRRERQGEDHVHTMTIEEAYRHHGLKYPPEN